MRKKTKHFYGGKYEAFLVINFRNGYFEFICKCKRLEFYRLHNILSLQQILENRASCIREITGNNIYLKAECIFISDQGLYMQVNDAGDYAYIPELCGDANGCFIRVNLTPTSDYNDAANNYKKTCRGCGWEYFTFCPNPNCPLKQKNNENKNK